MPHETSGGKPPATTANTAPEPKAHSTQTLLIFLVLGGGVGVLSGFFGIGGGVVLVPVLIGLFAFNPKVASATSLAAILPISIVGVTTYGIAGNIDWISGIPLAIGMVFGAILGTNLLRRISARNLQLFFALILIVAAVQLVFALPDRSSTLSVSPVMVTVIFLVGLAAGTLSGLIGVGGGIIIVPALVLGFGISDLLAKGISFVAITPGAITGSVMNTRNSYVDWKASLCLGIPGAILTPVGAHLAATASPRVAAVIFAVLMVLVALQMAYKNLKQR